MGVDVTSIEAARERAESAEAAAREQIRDAHADYGRVVTEVVDEHGATAVARALGVTRARVYQLMRKADTEA